MRPFYFGESAEPLFGLHHPATGAQTRRCGVVICNPIGQEYLRAHRALRQLATRLSDEGFHTLRFDYFGCGDSAGDDEQGHFDRWVEDLAMAVEELEAQSGASAVALVGLRLGASLAVRFAERAAGVEALVLWDPVADGRAHLAELEAAHASWIREHTRPAPERAGPGASQVLGFPLTARLRRDLEALDLGALERCPARRALVLATGDGEAPTLFPAGAGSAESVTRDRIAGAPPWLHGDGMESALVPVEPIERVAEWLCRQCA